jgi:hypothetical protein
MTTLLAIYVGRHCIGRCDAKCYDSTGADCDCICGGINHGSGKEQAVSNTREQAEEWIPRYAKEKGLGKYRQKINRTLVDQFTLFDSANLTKTLHQK